MALGTVQNAYLNQDTSLTCAPGTAERVDAIVAKLIEDALSAQAKLVIDRHALAGTDLAVHNLGRLTRRGQTAKNLGAYEEHLGPRALASLDQRTVVIIEPIILAALAHQTSTHHDLHFHPSQAKRPI